MEQNKRSQSIEFNSQERILKMAEEEGELLDEMIAQNQQMNLEMEKKRNPTKISQAQKNMQVLSNKAGQMASKVGSKVTKNGIQSPLGYQSTNT